MIIPFHSFGNSKYQTTHDCLLLGVSLMIYDCSLRISHCPKLSPLNVPFRQYEFQMRTKETRRAKWFEEMAVMQGVWNVWKQKMIQGFWRSHEGSNRADSSYKIENVDMTLLMSMNNDFWNHLNVLIITCIIGLCFETNTDVLTHQQILMLLTCTFDYTYKQIMWSVTRKVKQHKWSYVEALP